MDDHVFPKGTMLEINSFNPSFLYLHVVLSEMPFALKVPIFSCFNYKNYFPLSPYKILKIKILPKYTSDVNIFLLKLSNVVNRWFSLGALWTSCRKDLDNIHLPVSTAKQNVLHVFSSVQFSHSVVSNSLWPHGLQHTKPPCPSPTPGVYSNSCPSSQWCHLTTSTSVIPFSSHLQSFPASGSFQMSPLFASGGQSIGVSASTSVLPMNIQDWFPLGCTGWISLQSKGLSRVFSNTTVQKHQFFSTQLSL